LEDKEVRGELVRAFADDLSEGLPLRDGYACCAVLFVDTYEKLWTGQSGPNSAQGQETDAWVRALYTCLHAHNRLLLVIAGRDRLAWPAVDPRWRNLIDDHLLGGLSPVDAQRYLSRCGVGDPPEVSPPSPLQSAIIDCSTAGKPQDGCLPFYVGLCANIVLNERGPQGRGADPPPSTFLELPSDQVARALARRFMTSLAGPEQEELVRELCVPRWFDEGLLQALTGGDVGRARASERLLRSFSFIEKTGEGVMRMHGVMRDALQRDLEVDCPQVLCKLHRRCRDFWQARFEDGDSQAEIEAWYHWLHLAPGAAFESWRGKARTAIQERRGADARACLTWWDDVDLTKEAWRNAWGDVAWASTLGNLACSLDDLRPFAWQHGAVLEQVIECDRAALRVYTEEAFPADWAATIDSLGKAYRNLPSGDRAENLRQAVECYRAAQRIYTEEAFPAHWAATMRDVGTAYCDEPGGDLGENLRQAIECFETALRVYTEGTFPTDWAWTMSNLGNAYCDLPEGDRGENLRLAIGCFQAALRVRTEESFPTDWAWTKNNLGHACYNLPGGDREENLRLAIECFQSALRVYTEEAFPTAWAWTMQNLGAAYARLPGGEPGEGPRRAIECYQAALRVRTEQDFPADWAWTMNNLGNAYSKVPSDGRGENLRQAMECYRAAQRVFTEEACPADWAMTMHNLGNAYQNVPGEDRDESVRLAMACYQAALRVFTEEDFPVDWAATAVDLGTACVHRTGGDPVEHRCLAVECYQTSLRVYTEEAYPSDWAETTYNLACALSLAGDARAAVERLAAAVAFAPQYRGLAREDQDFVSLRSDPDFQALMVEPSRT
jgi:tetratricopeptide (TPR) repeat protein